MIYNWNPNCGYKRQERGQFLKKQKNQGVCYEMHNISENNNILKREELERVLQ